MKAEVKNEYIPVVYASVANGVHVVSVRCADYDVFVGLPRAIEFEGRLLGLTGWNSDRHLAYYKSNVVLARSV